MIVILPCMVFKFIQLISNWLSYDLSLSLSIIFLTALITMDNHLLHLGRLRSAMGSSYKYSHQQKGSTQGENNLYKATP